MKFFVVQTNSSDGDEYSIHNSSLCSPTCYGHSCDHWDGNTCGELESEYRCDCSGCNCEVVLETASCASTCYGYSCDVLETAGGCMCGWLESAAGCDCSGCDCESLIRNTSTNVVKLPAYESAADDFYGRPIQGKPFASSLRKLQYCIAPGDYTMLAIDNAGDGWWGNAYYSVIVGGTTVIHEEMGRISSWIQSTPFTVNTPARTTFSENKAPQGGGGALFWEDMPPVMNENLRDESESNAALYGDFIATPARVLSTTRHSYNAFSGLSMTVDHITLGLTDR